MKAVRFPIACLLAALAGLATVQVAAQSAREVVFCFNEQLGTVQEMLAGDCKGRVVTKDEAAAVRDRRQDYIRKVLTKAPDSRLEGKTLTAQGSGFFVSDAGTVLTSEHVVTGCSAVSVTPTFGEMAVATAIVPAEAADLALIHTAVNPPGIASFVEGTGPAILETAFAVGYPEQGMATITPMLTAVEVLRREGNTVHGPAIVVRGEVRRGNSGGPLLNGSGDVVGVVTAKVDTVSVYDATGAVVPHIGLVLPNDRIRDFLTAQGVRFNSAQRRPNLDGDRMLQEARPFMVRIGCWN